MCVKPILLPRTGVCAAPPGVAESQLHTGTRVPCGFCVECRSRYARMWAIRCVHEASLHDESCFGTLTYDDEHLPEHGSLDRKAFPLFMKRVRKSLGYKKVRYYHAGEYGEVNYRPHYHFLLFGHMFGDRMVIKESEEFILYRSGELESLWKFGLSSLGDVSFRSASYVARYVMKKVDQVGRKKKYSCDPETGEMHEIEPEYSTMSRGRGDDRGIGYRWYANFSPEVERDDSVVIDGQELMPPRYYDELFRERDVAAFEVMKLRRARKNGRVVMTRELMAREVIARERLDGLTRSI